jgi:4-amino-4-deoxychorismate lyase
MCRFIESIRIADRKTESLAYHQQRMDLTTEHFFGKKSGIHLEDVVTAYLQHSEYEYMKDGVYKMRLVYSQQVEQVTFHLYTTPSIGSLQLVEDDVIEYHFKFLDRSALERLYSRKGKSDDILIVKNGYISDSSYANVAFFDGHDWYTPQNPLLKGTQRALLLQQNRLKLAEIAIQDLVQFTKARLFNAMIRWEDQLDIEMSNIHSPSPLP